ncbi:MAG: type II secretion system protein [Candidatus Jorgensenbacteria bacterium]|nr:type II secretion system protein [Candidatus Jorgensenbacteria bacterium]
MFFKNNVHSESSGFTLIEMLVVVAIIGILSATVLSALGPARNKAKDARIVSDVNQVRAIAETLYDPGSSSPYSNVKTTETNISKISTDITNQGGALVITLNPTTAYAAYSKLASDSSKYYCVDSAGTTKTETTEPGNSATTCP